jgi:integrase/recombinase XerC
VDFSTGLVTVRRGKGNKSRAAVCGAALRQELLKYRRTQRNGSDLALVFQARGGIRFTGAGLLRVFQRLSKRSGITVSPHVCGRTCATLSALAGMPVPLLRSLLGHASIEITLHYVRLAPGDLLQAHREHSPIDSL